MPNGFGRGGGSGRSFGGGMGFGFRGVSPPWPYVGRGRGGLPRCGYYFGGVGAPVTWSYQSQSFYSGIPPTPGYVPYSTQIIREEELTYMKDQAAAIKGQLEEIDSRMHNMEADK